MFRWGHLPDSVRYTMVSRIYQIGRSDDPLEKNSNHSIELCKRLLLFFRTAFFGKGLVFWPIQPLHFRYKHLYTSIVNRLFIHCHVHGWTLSRCLRLWHLSEKMMKQYHRSLV